IQNSTSRVGEGKRLVEAAGTTIQEFVSSVQNVTQMMSEIASASQEQMKGIEQVSDAMTQMDRVVQQNEGLVAEAASVTQTMAYQAANLMDSVARFKLHESETVVEPGPRTMPIQAQPALVVARIERRQTIGEMLS